ncbi:TPA: hypothetical protein ROX79_005503 [Bacillus thuringiensis]|nr:hypothetical protein [Bacillus thuringiensis]
MFWLFFSKHALFFVYLLDSAMKIFLKGFGLLALHILFKLTANVCLPPSVPLVKVMNPGMSPVCSHIGTLLGSLVS